MEIIGMILIILALCTLAAVVFFAGPSIIVAAAAVAEIIEAKAEEWREIIKAAKGEK